MFSSVVLATAEDGTLLGMPRLGTLAMGVATLVPPLFWMVERRVATVPPPAVALASEA